MHWSVTIHKLPTNYIGDDTRGRKLVPCAVYDAMHKLPTGSMGTGMKK